MAISFKKYVDIISGVGAATVVDTRELIGRLFTENPLLPVGSYIEFDQLSDVGIYFGSTSEEYKRASFYFSFISKNISAPDKISFARWANVNTAPYIYGAKLVATLGALQLITNGSFSLTLGGVTHVISALDFAGAGSLTAIATAIQAAINAQSGTQWTSATVTYDSTRGAFNFVGGDAVAANLVVAPGNVGTDISALIGWYPQAINGVGGAIWSNGTLAETITDTLTMSAQASNNFGSFLFIPQLTDNQIEEAAAWNSAQDQNVLYQYMVRVPDVTKAALYGNTTNGLLINFAGIGMTFAPLATEYPEQCPMMILAATQYENANSTQNYMYQIFNLTPSVSDDATSNLLDGYRVNYYGQTQNAGQFVQFYQRGMLTGLPVNPNFMNIYANEQWLKEAIAVAILNLQLGLPKISANVQGINQVLTVIQSIIDLALFNNTISVGTNLTVTQKLYITQVTNDPKAWYQVQNIGYWLNCVIQQYQNNANITEYKIVYTLVYKKDDVVNKVEGAHILI